MVASMDAADKAAIRVGLPPICISTTSFSGLRQSFVNKSLVARSAPAPKRETPMRFPFKSATDLISGRATKRYKRLFKKSRP
jgi:hypothetical protein